MEDFDWQYIAKNDEITKLEWFTIYSFRRCKEHTAQTRNTITS